MVVVKKPFLCNHCIHREECEGGKKREEQLKDAVGRLHETLKRTKDLVKIEEEMKRYKRIFDWWTERCVMGQTWWTEEEKLRALREDYKLR